MTDDGPARGLRQSDAIPPAKPTCGWCRGNPIGDCVICQAKPSTLESYADPDLDDALDDRIADLEAKLDRLRGARDRRRPSDATYVQALELAVDAAQMMRTTCPADPDSTAEYEAAITAFDAAVDVLEVFVRSTNDDINDVPEETTVCNAGVGTQCKDGRWCCTSLQSAAKASGARRRRSPKRRKETDDEEVDD